MITLTHPSFENVVQAARDIVTSMNADGYVPDRIIALARGGAILGVILSHLLKVPVTIVSYSSKSGNGDNKNHDNKLPEVDGQSLLIVDEIVDSGLSMKEVANWYLFPQPRRVRTASMYAKEGSAYTPDYCWHPLASDAPFIYFPWEVL